jgi:large subunit ribosomal protein L4
MESTVYNQKGEQSGKIKLPEDIFGLPWNGDLVHQVMVSMRSSARKPIAHTKNRGEVAGGGKKPWKQKGTGRARHGSIRSPIWVGGGVTHGPRNDKNYYRKVNRKMKLKALFTILSKKLEDNEILFVDKLSFDTPKTKNGLFVLNALSKTPGFKNLLNKNKNSALIALSEKDKNTVLSLRNFSNIVIDEVKNLNPLTALGSKYVIFSNPKNSLDILSAKNLK